MVTQDAGDEIVRRYSNGEITVIWRPELCVHSRICFRGLPAVFDPRRRPWVDASAASSDAISTQVAACPSGALSLAEPYLGKPEQIASRESIAEVSTSEVEIEALPGGPLVVRGRVIVRDASGNATLRETKTSLCRCGSSGNKPYCDGTHRRVGFTG